MQPCGRRLSECIDDVCRSGGECAWADETSMSHPVEEDFQRRLATTAIPDSYKRPRITRANYLR